MANHSKNGHKFYPKNDHLNIRLSNIWMVTALYRTSLVFEFSKMADKTIQKIGPIKLQAARFQMALV
jgi:hypothetical protein